MFLQKGLTLFHLWKRWHDQKLLLVNLAHPQLHRFHQQSHLSVKMTQINFISRKQLHNTANSCQHLNFGLIDLVEWCHGVFLTISRDMFKNTLLAPIRKVHLAWLRAKCKGKTLLTIEIFFALHKDCTVTA